MRKERKITFVAKISAILLVFTLSCQTTPETNRSQLILIDKGSEMKMGDQAYRDILKKSKISKDQALTARLNKIGREIGVASRVKGYAWEFKLIESDIPNAYCLPGGKVGVHTGITPFAKNEAGLAAIIGHEVGHAVARHGGERMSHAILLGLAGELVAQGMIEGKANRELFRAGYGAGSAVAVTLPFSRSHELEADRMGLLYMARAGYDPREAINFWRRFANAASKGKRKKPPEFLSTHPADKKRISQIEKYLPDAMKEYNRAQNKKGVGRSLF